ncbi:MAG: PorT family protein [Bacteroidales bacterium]|nr:PorT family protein [Bacteroidales bacterium]
MKTRLFSFVLILILSTSFAVSQKTSFGILGGINLQNLNGKDSDGDKLELSLTPGFHAGVNVQIPIAPDFYFQSGLLYTSKGAKNNEASPTVKDRLTYLELPLNVVYKGLLGKGHVLLGFGPYLGYAISGKVIFETDVKQDIEFTNVVEASAPALATYYKALDAGANIFAGFEMANGIFFQLDTQLGLLKINPEDKRITDDKTSIKNTGFGLSAGYRF